MVKSLKKADEVFKSYEKLKELQKLGSGLDWTVAKELAYQKKDHNYRLIMGDPEATWRAFLAQPELQMIHVQKADRLVKIYETYIDKLGLDIRRVEGIDTNSLQRLANLVTKQNVEDWLNKARNLSRSDLYREIRYGDVDEMKCQHTFIIKKVCKFCGTREKIIEKTK